MSKLASIFRHLWTTEVCVGGRLTWNTLRTAASSTGTQTLHHPLESAAMADTHSNIRTLDHSDDVIAECCRSLQSGHVIAVPTDTIYGLTCLSQNRDGIQQLYAIKQRDPLKPIAICVGDVSDVQCWCDVTIPEKLLYYLLPGPVTVVFRRTPQLNPDLNPDTPLVGVRVPDCTFIRELSRRCCSPLALTSANSSNTLSSLAICEFQNLWARLDLIVDGGQLGLTDCARLGSTVVDLSSQGRYRILRAGSAETDTVRKLEKYGLVKDV